MDFREIFLCLYDTLFKVVHIGDMKGMYGRRIKKIRAQTHETDNVSIKEERQITPLVCRTENCAIVLWFLSLANKQIG